MLCYKLTQAISCTRVILKVKNVLICCGFLPPSSSAAGSLLLLHPLKADAICELLQLITVWLCDLGKCDNIYDPTKCEAPSYIVFLNVKMSDSSSLIDRNQGLICNVMNDASVTVHHICWLTTEYLQQRIFRAILGCV